MKKWFLLLLVLAVAGLVLIIGLGRMSRARGQRALEQYKAELRAKGEKLTWEELGFPRSPEANGGFAKFFAAVARLGPGTRIRTAFDARSFVAPGQARVAWASDTVPLAELEAEVSSSSESLAEIRQALENPPARWMFNPTNLPSPPRPDFVALRNAAQWLAGDCLFALRMNQQDRARDDLHALAQLTQVYREDLGLVTQMIRVAIAGLGLPVVWETLQAGGWTDAELAAMQQDWEKLCLTECPELGMVAQRAILEQAVTRLREGRLIR